MLSGIKQTLYTPGPRDTTETDRTVFECILWRYGSAVDCHRGRGSSCSRPGYGWVQQTWVWHKPSWKRLPLTPSIELPELTQDWEIDSWRAQQNLVHQDPEERSSDPRKR